MEFLINADELNALYGLPHIQQLVYLRGIRPYMDIKTSLVGIKRRISHQSISEQLYIEPRQGIKTQSFSRDQIRRAIYSLSRAGIITIQSEGMQLILKCQLASRHYSVQNKAAIKPPQKATINPSDNFLDRTEFSDYELSKADIAKITKAATPLIKDNYIYLLSQFEKFWSLYPEKKSRQSAWQVFEALNPDHNLCNKILDALQTQIRNREEKQARGIWIPPWKHPANWLTQRCWEDEITITNNQEMNDAKHRKNTRDESSKDIFWNPEESVSEQLSNVIPFKTCR